MGLDMYLEVRKYKSSYRGDGEQLAYPNELKELELNIRNRNFLSVESTYQVGYWRKFNALHSYIITNFNDGVDDCREIWLPIRCCEQILNDLKKINENNASEIMPTCEGFFFGSTRIDEYYFQDVKYSIDLFEKVIKLAKEYNYEVYYHASW